MTSRLGDLELEVLRVLWDAERPLSVREVIELLSRQRAYTTIMTTLARLHRKGYLRQRQAGRSYLYSPKISEASVLRTLVTRIADSLFNGDVRALGQRIVDIERPLSEAERKRLYAVARGIKARGR